MTVRLDLGVTSGIEPLHVPPSTRAPRRATATRWSLVLAAGLAFSACRIGYQTVDSSSLAMTGGSSGSGEAGADPEPAEAGSSPGAGGAPGNAGFGATSAGGALAEGGVGNGSTGGSSDAGSGGSATGGSGGASADLIVDTNVDESDAGATADAPGGSGLSLREALTIANAVAGRQIIGFEDDVVVALSNDLPEITEAVELRGGVVDASAASIGGNKDCLMVAAGPTLLDGLELYGCSARPVYLTGGAGSQVRGCYFHDNVKGVELSSNVGAGTIIGPDNLFERTAETAISIYADDVQVVDNRVLDNGNYAIFLSGTAANITILGNLLVRSGTAVGMASGTTNVTIWHNTIVGCTDSAIVVGQAKVMDVRNNIMAQSSGFAVLGSNDKFTHLEQNLFYQNAAGDCSPCSAGASNPVADPRFVSSATDDYALQAGSPAIDAGAALAVDRNGSAPGDFNDSAPDIGYRETP